MKSFTRIRSLRRSALLASMLLVVVGAVGFGLGRSVRADGIPDMNPLYYSGTLTEGGQPVDGTRALTINVWPDGSASTMPLCQTVVSATSVVGGQFRVPLASTCKAQLNQNNNAWVEVVDGATSLGRIKIGTVPYAVEADHAARATSATTAATAAALAAGPIAGGLTNYTVPGNALTAPCAATFGMVVDCACPNGSFAVSGGGDAGQASGHFLRESRALTMSAWRITCATAAGTDALCATYNVLCSRLGP
jgi:hypothetical protein